MAKITLHYTFEGYGECYDSYQPSDTISPRTHMGSYESDFDYEIEVCLEDYLECYLPRNFKKLPLEEQEKLMAELEKEYNELEENQWYDYPKEFYDYLWEKNQDDAESEFQELEGV